LIQVFHGLRIWELGEQLADIGAHRGLALGLLLGGPGITLEGQFLTPNIGAMIAEEELLRVDVGSRAPIDLDELDPLHFPELLAVGAVLDLFQLKGLLFSPLRPHGGLIEPICHIHLEGEPSKLYRTTKLRILRFPALDRPVADPEILSQGGIGEREVEPRQPTYMPTEAGIILRWPAAEIFAFGHV
jgi:hypothetical protein